MEYVDNLKIDETENQVSEQEPQNDPENDYCSENDYCNDEDDDDYHFKMKQYDVPLGYGRFIVCNSSSKRFGCISNGDYEGPGYYGVFYHDIKEMLEDFTLYLEGKLGIMKASKQEDVDTEEEEEEDLSWYSGSDYSSDQDEQYLSEMEEKTKEHPEEDDAPEEEDGQYREEDESEANLDSEENEEDDFADNSQVREDEEGENASANSEAREDEEEEEEMESLEEDEEENGPADTLNWRNKKGKQLP
jgi:hypothetical protein